MPDKSEPRDPEPTGRKEWAGLPIAYWIDLCVLEQESLFEILDQLRQQFPGYSREQHIETTITRLTERARKGEIFSTKSKEKLPPTWRSRMHWPSLVCQVRGLRIGSNMWLLGKNLER